MLRSLCYTLLVVFFACGSAPLKGQDVLAGQKIKALKGLKELSILIRPNFKDEIVTGEELDAAAIVSLNRDLPGVRLRHDSVSSTCWLELSVIQSTYGALIEVSAYRWVRVLDSGEEIFAPVWNDLKLVAGKVDKKLMKEALLDLLTNFAADHVRANK